MKPTPTHPKRTRRIGSTVIGFAWASLFSDVSHEMATAVLPMYLGTLGLGAAALGLVEGVADLLNGLSKLGGGIAGQRMRRKKPWTAAGYLVTAVATSALGFARRIPDLLLLRSVAWIGRGFRGPLRDSLIADAVEPTHYGRAYGLERAGDMIGAMLGPLATVGLLGLGLALRNVLLFSLVPGLLAASAVVFLVHEKPRTHEAPRTIAAVHGRLPRRFWPLMAAILAFGLGDFSRTLLILAAAQAATGEALPKTLALGIPVLLYVLHNAVSAGATFPAGRTADRHGKRDVLAAGYALGLGCNLLLAVGHGSIAALAVAFVLSGVYIAVEETVEKAMVAEILPREVRTYGLGVLATANAAGDMISSLLVGVLWQSVGGGVAFGTAAGFSALGFVLLLLSRRIAPAVTQDRPSGHGSSGAPGA